MRHHERSGASGGAYGMQENRTLSGHIAACRAAIFLRCLFEQTQRRCLAEQSILVYSAMRRRVEPCESIEREGARPTHARADLDLY